MTRSRRPLQSGLPVNLLKLCACHKLKHSILCHLPYRAATSITLMCCAAQCRVLYTLCELRREADEAAKDACACGCNMAADDADAAAAAPPLLLAASPAPTPTPAPAPGFCSCSSRDGFFSFTICVTSRSRSCTSASLDLTAL